MERQNFNNKSDKSNRLNIAIVHPMLRWGGSEAVVFWMIEALKNDYNISLITTNQIEIAKINKYYGTNLNEKEFRLIIATLPFIFKNTDKFSGLRGRFVQRYSQRISSQFDLMINAYNFCDFKNRGIQFATDIDELPNIIALSGFKKIWYGKSFLRKIYLKICDFISIDNPEEWKKNFTLSNSKWTAELIRKKYGIESKVLYPPVADNFLNISSEKREKGFIMIGRIIPEKKIDTAIEILKNLRQKDFNLHLHIIGGTGDNRYIKKIKKSCLENKGWLFFEGRLSEKKKKEFIANHLFGISCRKNEPFGIAVAEMARAGSIVFVPDGGGQTEITDNQNLIYRNIEDAVQKIGAVAKNEKLQSDLQRQSLLDSQKFSVENFKSEISNIIKQHLAK